MRQRLNTELRPYFDARHCLTVVDDLLLHGSRIVVPSSLQEETLEKIHQGHLGIQKCILRARTAVWWPGLSNSIKNLVRQCRECAEHSTQRREPLIPSPLPTYPWQKIGADLFQLDGAIYLLAVDYYSRYPEVVKLPTATSLTVISALKSIFSRHGIPEILRSDNGPQFDSADMVSFASSYGFYHDTSSPRYPQSNGQAERAVQTIKKLLKKSKDPYLSLLAYRSAPLQWCGYSPAELLMGRRLRTSLPQTQQSLIPSWSYLEQFRAKDECFKNQQKEHYDRRHRASVLPVLPDNTPVLVQTGSSRVPGTTISQADAPRSYLIQTSSGTVRRNRQHLIAVPVRDDPSSNQADVSLRQPVHPARSPIMTRSRTRQRKGDVEVLSDTNPGTSPD